MPLSIVENKLIYLLNLSTINEITLARYSILIIGNSSKKFDYIFEVILPYYKLVSHL